MKERKIFDERGFLTDEGKAFVNDGFIKETRRVFATAENKNDILIIASILKSVVAECAFDRCQRYGETDDCVLAGGSSRTCQKGTRACVAQHRLVENLPKPPESAISKRKSNIIPFPLKNRELVQNLAELMNTLSDVPPIDDPSADK